MQSLATEFILGTSQKDPFQTIFETMKNRLSDLSQGKENNLNLIRMIAASSVLITHSFALVTGTGASEPLRQSLGLTMGTISVHVFFIISGLLVTASLVNKGILIDFFWARSLRIFPALFLMILLVVFFLGPFFTTIDFIDYMKSKETYIYIAKCSTLIFGVRDHLPGVFHRSPIQKFSQWLSMDHALRSQDVPDTCRNLACLAIF